MKILFSIILVKEKSNLNNKFNLKKIRQKKNIYFNYYYFINRNNIFI